MFEQYERRFAEARLRMPERNPAAPADREAIVRAVKDCLGIRDRWIPKIHAEKVRDADFDGGRIEMLRAASWPGVAATALLYLPIPSSPQPSPLLTVMEARLPAASTTLMWVVPREQKGWRRTSSR